MRTGRPPNATYRRALQPHAQAPTCFFLAACGCSQVDYLSKNWTCPFCLTRNIFPPHYAEHITETNLPAELMPELTTVEYQLPGRVAAPPALLFVIDAALPEDELSA